MALGACALAAARGAGAPAEAPLDHVVLQLKWRHQFQFAGYYAAVARGYYREAGLEVELREAGPERDPAEAVLSGEADFGVGNSDLLLMRAAGRPVVVLAAVFQHSPLLLVTRVASGVSDLQGLHDRPIMMIDSEKAELLAYFKYEGVDLTRLRIRPHTFNHRDFIDGRVDAMSAYGTDEPYTLRQEGVAFHAFTARSGGIDFYGDNLYTTESQIRRHADRVRAFRAASLRGWEYALAHPEEIVDLILARYTQRHTREHLLFEAAKTAELMHPGVIEVGHMNPGRWRHIADTYAEFGLLPRDFPLTGFLYDPNPAPDETWLYWTLAGALFAAVALLGWALPLYRLNRKLRHEIAERRRAEVEMLRARDAAEAANEAKGRYLAVMTHEVRTPMNGIVGFLDLLRAGPLTAEQRSQIDQIDTAAHDLLKLVNDVLDYSRLESGRLELERLSIMLSDFALGLCDFFRRPAEAKGVALRYVIRPGTPAMIVSDPLRLRQILTNLLSNAVKFTAAGTVELAIEAEAVAEEPRRCRVRFLVRDTGVGIAPERLPRLFQPYAQADASIARQFGGTGLGLVISQRLAELFGGGLTVESAPGRGTTFTLTILAEAGTGAPAL